MITAIKELIEESINRSVPGILNFTYDEIINLIEEHIVDIIENENIDIEIIGIELHGSRLRGTYRENSDLDAVVEYRGNFKEDSLFNILNEDPLFIESIQVDINPIRKEETGTLKDYMIKSKQYDKTILEK